MGFKLNLHGKGHMATLLVEEDIRDKWFEASDLNKSASRIHVAIAHVEKTQLFYNT
jgi:hypothetical protein